MLGPLYDLAHATPDKQQAVNAHLNFLQWFGRPARPGSRVLDFGCGVGHSVAILVDMGYDAYGCDIGEWWGKDREQARLEYGVNYVPPPHIAERLRTFSVMKPSLPFPPDHFDFCFSDQVIEHVLVHTTAFRQIASVLKPDGVSVHRFPGPNMLFEGHIFLPFPALCHNKAYLAAWAMLGRRAPSQREYSRRDVLAANVRAMQTVNYRTKRQLRESARQANVDIAFFELEEMRLRDVGTAAKVVARAKRFGLDGLLAKALSRLSQRYMVLTRV